MNRRDGMLAMLAVGAAGCVAAWAQDAHKRGPFRLGLVPDMKGSPLLDLFNDALRQLGRVEGRDYVFIHSGVPYGPDSDAALERVLAARPDLLLTMNLGYAVAAHKVTKTVPIVMLVSGFPVEGGVADSLNRPGRNVTGLTLYAGPEVFAKLCQLLQETKPDIRRIGVFLSYVPPFNPRAETDHIIRSFRTAARPRGPEVRIFEIARPEQVDDAFAWAIREGVDALVLTSGISVAPRMRDIFKFAVARRLPAIIDAPWGELGDPQPLLVYMPSFATMMRQGAAYADQILWKGAKPGELPIQLPARFEFRVNLKTAKALGIVLPPSILVRADQVSD